VTAQLAQQLPAHGCIHLILQVLVCICISSATSATSLCIEIPNQSSGVHWTEVFHATVHVTF
jgi:hypothetical protein